MSRVAVLVVALVLGVAGCSGGRASPTSPTRATQPPAPPITLTGHVVATNGGQPLGAVSVDFGSRPTLTDAMGAFLYQMPSGGTSRLLLSGPGIVSRSLLLNANASRDVTVDAIRTAGFDLNFYRQLVRNGFEEPNALQPLRRWTRTPSLYLKTVDEAGVAIDSTTLATIERTAAESIPQWTSGKLGVPIIERGTGTREGKSGWITIKFPAANTEEGYCGRAQIAVDGGWMELYYTRLSSAVTRCRFGGAVIVPRTVRHELGHALGFFHSDSPNDLMFGGTWFSSQSDQGMSFREFAAATIAYMRPVGNTDPDVDPSGAVTLVPMHVH